MPKRIPCPWVAGVVGICGLLVSSDAAGNPRLRSWVAPAMGGAAVESWDGGLMAAGTLSFQKPASGPAPDSF